MYKETDRQTYKQTDRQTDRQSYGQYKQRQRARARRADRKIVKIEGHRDRNKDVGKTGSETDKSMERKTDGINY